MATLELQRPQPQRTAPILAHRSPSLSSAPPTPCSPTIIRTPDFILLPSVPTHEPEDNLPSPMALQHQFAIAAHNDAQARRSRQNSRIRNHSAASDEPRTAATSSLSDFSQRSSGSSSNNSHMLHDQDELEEIVELDSCYDWDPAESHDALRDIRNQQLDSLQTIVHSVAETHFQQPSSSSAPDSDVTQILDDLFASLRRIGGHNAPLSPTFARSAAPGVNQITDVDRLALLVDRLSLAYRDIQDAHQADLLAALNTLAQSLIASERRLARAALESPPRTPRALAAARRRRSAHSPQSSALFSGSRDSFSSIRSYATLSTSSDEAVPTPSSDAMLQQKKIGAHPRSASSPAANSKTLDLPSQQAVSLSAVPEQQHIDGPTFDMTTVRTAPSSRPSASTFPFSLETLYAHQASALGLMHPQSPRSDQASRAASVGERSESTALHNRKRYSVQTDSAASTMLPSYDSVGKASSAKEDGLPQYDPSLAVAGFSADVKKPVEAPTLLERRRAKLAAQHSAYAARTPEDLAMVQSSIDRLSTVMPQLDNQRVLSPEEQREAQLQHMIGRLAESSSKRLNDQRSNPPSFRAQRPAPVPRSPSESSAPVLPQLGAVSELPRKEILNEPETSVPKTPTTPVSVHSASSSRRSSLLPSAFARKISISSISNALRRASIYDTTKVKPKEPKEVTAAHTEQVAAAPVSAGNDRTIRRGDAATTQDSRSKSDIADGLASFFNDGKSRKGSVPETSKAATRAAQSFRAIDFADDTPRGRDASLIPPASVEEEDDSILDDYSFATIDTTTSNHRLSLLPEPPRSPASWASSLGSRESSRRSSQLTTSIPATPTWPKSPLTPISPVAPRRSPTAVSKPTVTFAADTLRPTREGRAMATESQLRENGASHLRPSKSPPAPVMPSLLPDPPCEPACASVVAAAAASDNDLVVYALLGISSTAKTNAADHLVRSATSSPPQSDLNGKVVLDYLVEAQHSLGSVSVMMWTETSAVVEFKEEEEEVVELKYEVVGGDEDGGRILDVVAVDGNTVLTIARAPCESDRGEDERCRSDSSSGSGEQRGIKRKQAGHHVSEAQGVRVTLPAAAQVPQSGRVQLRLRKPSTSTSASGAVCRFKLEMTDAERQAGKELARGEGMVVFPLDAAVFNASAALLTTSGDTLHAKEADAIAALACAVCAKHVGSSADEVRAIIKVARADGMQWRALPSEGWEELVDAWMCHADQELNRSLTETAVRFAGRVHAGASGGESEEEVEQTVWVGDTYFLVPRGVLESETVVFEQREHLEAGAQQTVLRCATCRSALGEVSSAAPSAGGATTAKLSKYMLEPLFHESLMTSTNTWVETLLAALQYSAASHGSRRFLIQPSSPSTIDQGIEAWLFSRALFTTSLTRHWSTLTAHYQPQPRDSVWRGHRLFYRTPPPTRGPASPETEAMETIELPGPVYGWMLEAMEECHASLPPELGKVLPLWNTAYLAKEQ
ncbi:hypothetical protein EX895_001592 [Sporisorium graminicola]|uniref:HECT domain-containing protein n=1 Tax=Sporisorium graminicola TaxID=280036 RepID=A0A4U7KWH7_9BASI|nr:hypothetical protein EX895_001592 [Sporisorium graminicola]TKY89061.1 hypothetical protein EX895_001592 [Sporisorium graminicola]